MNFFSDIVSRQPVIFVVVVMTRLFIGSEYGIEPWGYSGASTVIWPTARSASSRKAEYKKKIKVAARIVPPTTRMILRKGVNSASVFSVPGVEAIDQSDA